MATLGRVRERRVGNDRTAIRQFALLFIAALALLVARDSAPVRDASRALTTALVPLGNRAPTT